VSSVVSREGSLARDRQSGRNSSSLTGNSFYDETSQPTGTLQVKYYAFIMLIISIQHSKQKRLMKRCIAVNFLTYKRLP